MSDRPSEPNDFRAKWFSTFRFLDDLYFPNLKPTAKSVVIYRKELFGGQTTKGFREWFHAL